MQPSNERFGRHLLWVAVAAVGLYGLSFALIERHRSHLGPWEVEFSCFTNAQPCLTIQHPALGVRDVRLVFPGAAPADFRGGQRLEFREARAVPFAVPFGRCVFIDTTSLPGTVAMEIAGYSVQLIPRVLTIDGVERSWRAGEVIFVKPKAPPPPAKP